MKLLPSTQKEIREKAERFKLEPNKLSFRESKTTKEEDITEILYEGTDFKLMVWMYDKGMFAVQYAPAKDRYQTTEYIKDNSKSTKEIVDVITDWLKYLKRELKAL